jgi:hypothetical protein
MRPTAEPPPEVVAATDAVFKEGSPAAAEPNPPAVSAAPAARAPARPPAKDDSPLHDWVRELGEEYQRQQDEGRL